jgi:N-glycosidase YbiA
VNSRRVIEFHRTGDAYGEFSNFAEFPIRLHDREWPTSEHYFQARKFVGTPHEEAVRLADSPMTAAKMGRERSRPLRPDWESVKDDIMREAVLAKFTQHPKLLGLLLSTGDAEIVEHTKNDAYWGDGGDGSGKNMLGRILMEVRRRLGGLPEPAEE